ncbi:glutamate--tRNA ligase [Physcia stellaris]|nr:glutamate--tRNA ligase [Physcia stellaris]
MTDGTRKGLYRVPRSNYIVIFSGQGSIVTKVHRVVAHMGRIDRLILRDESDERASHGEAHVIRLKTPSQLPNIEDLVYGTVGNRKLAKLGSDGLAYEDIILLKSDGLPTYHLANVVDDNSMRITHVIRAVEWISSTPKHLLLYKSFGWEPPYFAHVGLLQDGQQQKLSKRDGKSADLNVRGFRDRGILPEALLNYVALYGWSHNKASDVFNLEELVRTFDLKFTKGNTIVKPEKLKYFQKSTPKGKSKLGGRFLTPWWKKYMILFESISSSIQSKLSFNLDATFALAKSFQEQ